MKVLSIDPGAERCGWAVLEPGLPGPKVTDSGVFRCPRNDEDFQDYRIRLENEAFYFFLHQLTEVDATHVVNEIVPAVGGGNFVVATQSYLVNTVVASLHIAAFIHGVWPEQIAARTVQKRVGITGRTGKVTKAGMRNGVVTIIPDLLPHVSAKDEWPWDRWDAIGIGIAYMGYSIERFKDT